MDFTRFFRHTSTPNLKFSSERATQVAEAVASMYSSVLPDWVSDLEIQFQRPLQLRYQSEAAFANP